MRKERNTAIVLLLILILITLVILFVLISTGRLDTVWQNEKENQSTVMEELEQEDFATEDSTHSPKETVDDFSNPEDTQNSESADLPPQEEENDDATLDQEKENDSSQTMKRVNVSCAVQRNETGVIEGKTIELSLEVPADWIQSDTGTMFYHTDGSKAAEGFWATIIPEGQTIWSTAKVDLIPGYVSSQTVTIQGQEVLLSICSVPWGKEEEPPEEQKKYCYNYHIPYQDMYIIIQIYAVGKDNEEAIQLHREILESISFFSDQKEKSPQTPSVSKKTEENKSSEEAKSEESSDTSSEKEKENLSESEKKELFRQYIEPYYIVGLMYDNWDSPEEISADRLIKFYTYNCLERFLEKTEQKDPGYLSSHSEILVPESDVESFINSYFKVDKEYLHTAQSYQPDTKSYLFSTTVGVGGGPMEIIRIEKDEKNWKFICQDAEGTELSVTIEMVNKDQFYYVAGKSKPPVERVV